MEQLSRACKNNAGGFNFNDEVDQQSGFSSPPHVCIAISHLQNVRTHGSEFVWKCTHFPVKLVFINSHVCLRSGVRTFQALFCLFATVINETPELYHRVVLEEFASGE